MDKLRLEEGNGLEDYLEARQCGDGIVISICEPWAGDTNTGFGREGSITLTREQALELAKFLSAPFQPSLKE